MTTEPGATAEPAVTAGAGVTVLRVPGFRLLWSAGLISDAGDWLLLVALPILVYQLTGSTLGTALAFLVELAPPILLGTLAGRLADRWNRRRALVILSLVQAAALLPLVATRALWAVYLVIGAEAILATLFDPSKNALLPTLVPPGDLVRANALLAVNNSLGRLVGGSLGGALLAFTGVHAVVAVDAATFLLAATFLARVPASAPHLGTPRRVAPATTTPPPAGEPQDRTTPEGTMLEEDAARTGQAGDGLTSDGMTSGGLTSDGLTQGGQSSGADAGASAGTRRVVRTVLATAAVCAVAQGIFAVLFVPFVARVLHGDAAETGLLRGVQAIGSIAAGLLLGLLPARRRARPATPAPPPPPTSPTATTATGGPRTRATAPSGTATSATDGGAGRRIAIPALARAVGLAAVGAGLFGVVSLVVWNGPLVTRAEPVYILLFVLVGAPGTILETGLISTLQDATTEGTRGRMFGQLAVVYAAGQAVGELGAGLLGDRLGVLPLVNIQACLYLLGGLIAATALTRPRGDRIAAQPRASAG